jgi:hypothetical protein
MLQLFSCLAVAVDAETGKEVCKTKRGDIDLGESMAMAPLVVKDKVLAGNSGGEFGVRGWLTALNIRAGQIAWRAYSTGPDAEVLIGQNFKPFYGQDQGQALGVTSWPPDAWRIGGGTVLCSLRRCRLRYNSSAPEGCETLENTHRRSTSLGSQRSSWPSNCGTHHEETIHGHGARFHPRLHPPAA